MVGDDLLTESEFIKNKNKSEMTFSQNVSLEENKKCVTLSQRCDGEKRKEMTLSQRCDGETHTLGDALVWGCQELIL